MPFHMLLFRFPSRMTVHQWRQIMGATTNRKVVPSSYTSCSFGSNFLSASLRLLGVPKMIAKNRSCLRYSVTGGESLVSLSNGDANKQHDLQRTYQVVVAATRDMGIGKDGELQWRLPSDLNFFKEITITTSVPGKKNAVVMGRKTWESIPFEHRPLPGRLNIVLTRSGRFDISAAENVVICGGIQSALKLLAVPPYCFSIEKVFIIGGGQILRESLNAPGCDAIHMTEIESKIECDTFIPPVDACLFQPWYSSLPLVENNIRYCFVTYVCVKKCAKVEDFTFLPKMIFEKHDEYIYLRLLQDVISRGNQKGNRTGTGTLSNFGCPMRFNLRKCFPLFTTESIFWQSVVEELFWFISKSTNGKVLKKDIHIWDANASRDYLDRIGLADREVDDLGPTYGFHWGHFGARYTNMRPDYSGQGFDQFLDVIDKIRNKPDNRPIILSVWNQSDLKLMALPPCRMLAQFYVAHGELSCQLYQQSADVGVLPFNIASYALLTCTIAHVCGLVPGDLIYVIGDVHVHEMHIRPLKEQLQKLPKPFPILKINPQKMDVNSFVGADFELIGYDPLPEDINGNGGI